MLQISVWYSVDHQTFSFWGFVKILVSPRELNTYHIVMSEYCQPISNLDVDILFTNASPGAWERFEELVVNAG